MHAEKSVSGREMHRYRTQPVTNESASARRIVLCSGAASIGHGTFNVAPGRTPNDLTTWITLRPGVLSLAAGASARVTARIAVPRNASSGERYAGIWAQTATAYARHRQDVLEVSRVGIRVYLAVGKGGPPAANFAITSLTARRQSGGQPVVTAQVRDTGGRALDLSGELTLAQGHGGLSAGPFPARLGTTIAPGQNLSGRAGTGSCRDGARTGADLGSWRPRRSSLSVCQPVGFADPDRHS